MDRNIIFKTIEWEGQRYYVPQRYWSYAYFVLGSGVVLRRCQKKGKMDQIQVELVEVSINLDEVNVAHLKNPLPK